MCAKHLRTVRCGCLVVMPPRSVRPQTGRQRLHHGRETVFRRCEQAIRTWWAPVVQDAVDAGVPDPRPARGRAATTGRSPSAASDSARCSPHCSCGAGRVVPTEQLVDELWGERAAEDRDDVAPERGLAAPEGARAGRPRDARRRATCSQVDRTRSTRDASSSCSRTRARAATGGAARRCSQRALALWRGPPLAEFAFEDFAQAEIRRLEELRLVALEERIDADLELGRHGDVVAELEALVARASAARDVRASC